MPIRGRKFGQAAVYGAAAASTPFSLTFVTDNTTTSAGASSLTFTSQSIGTADATRIVAVGFTWHGATGNTIASVTIGGISASQATSAAATPTSVGSLSDIWYAAVPTGTTGTVVVNFNSTASVSRCGIFIYRVVGTGAAFSAGGSGSTGGGTATAQNASAVTVPSGGGAMAVGLVHSTGQTIGNNSTNLTMDVTNLNPGASDTYGSGHDTTHSGSQTYGMSWVATTDAAVSVAAFSP